MQSNDAWVPRFLVIDDEPSSSTSCDWGEIFWKPPKHKVFLFLAWKDGSCWDKLSYTSAFWDWMFDDSFFALERYVDADMFPSWNIVDLESWKWPTWFRMLASLTDHLILTMMAWLSCPSLEAALRTMALKSGLMTYILLTKNIAGLLQLWWTRDNDMAWPTNLRLASTSTPILPSRNYMISI